MSTGGVRGMLYCCEHHKTYFPEINLTFWDKMLARKRFRWDRARANVEFTCLTGN